MTIPRALSTHQILRSIWDYKTFERLPGVRCPALAIAARPANMRNDEERAFVENKQRGIERAGQLLPHMQIQWMEDTIHDIPLQRPEALAKLILDFAATLH
jgi:pimeloyl-ACP methyl ester carboxylesterase